MPEIFAEQLNAGGPDAGARAPLLDRGEAAERLHVSERTVRRWGRSGLLDARRVGPRLAKVTEASVEALIRAGRSGPVGSEAAAA